MTAVSKNVYINRLDKIVVKYNKTYHQTTKMKPPIVHQGKCIEYGVEHNYKDRKFKVGYCVRIFLQKATLQIGLKKSL